MDIKAVIFDIDGTLTPQNSWTAFTKDIGGSVTDHLAIYQEHLDGKIGLDESKAKLLQMWLATGNANKKHIEKVFNDWPIRSDSKSLVDWLKEQGYIICLITGSVGIYAKHIANELGIDYYYSNAELFFGDNGELIDFHYTANQAEVKLLQFNEFCKLNNLKSTECVAVGDGDNDIELFKVTKHGILVDHEKVSTELRQSAWQIVDSLSKITDILANK